MTNTIYINKLTTEEVSHGIGISISTIHKFIKNNPEYKPAHMKRGNRNSYWTYDEARKLGIAFGKTMYVEMLTNIIKNYVESEPETANPEPETTVTIPEPKNPIDIQIEMADKVEQDENFSAFMHLKKIYDTYNEHDLSVMFGEVLRRFKFSYITECVPSVQSQTLTAIRKGSLRGIDSFQFSFKSFLELMKFAGEHNTPVTEVNKA